MKVERILFNQSDSKMTMNNIYNGLIEGMYETSIANVRDRYKR